VRLTAGLFQSKLLVHRTLFALLLFAPAPLNFFSTPLPWCGRYFEPSVRPNVLLALLRTSSREPFPPHNTSPET
jgi:hypothetical protein